MSALTAEEILFTSSGRMLGFLFGVCCELGFCKQLELFTQRVWSLNYCIPCLFLHRLYCIYQNSQKSRERKKVILYWTDTIFTCLRVEYYFMYFLSCVTIFKCLSCCASPKIKMLWEYHLSFSCDYDVVCLPEQTWFGADVCLRI